ASTSTAQSTSGGEPLPSFQLRRGQPHDGLADTLMTGRCFRRRRDNLKLRSRVHTQKLMFPLPDADREQTTLDAASERFLVKHLRERIELPEIGLDHPKTRHSIDWPQPLERSIEIVGAEPELSANRSQRSASRQRLGDRFIALFLPDCCPDYCVGHA